MTNKLFGNAPQARLRPRSQAIHSVNRWRRMVWGGLLTDTTGHLISSLGHGTVLMMQRAVFDTAVTESTALENHGHRDSYDGGYSLWGFTGPR